MNREFVAALEQRRLLSVTAHIRLLHNEDVIQAGQSANVNALPNAAGTGTNFGSGDALTSTVRWDFGDPKGLYNKLPGFNAAHQYDQPGTYKITLRITNAEGEHDTASRIIKVKPSKQKTIYINPWGSDKNNGRTPDKAVASIARAVKLIGNNTSVYFRRQMKFNVTAPIELPFSNVKIGAYGSGRAPELQLPAGSDEFAPMFLLSRPSHQIAIENLLMDSGGKTAIGQAIRAAGSNITIKNCEFEHLYDAIQTQEQPTGLLALRNRAGVLRGYFAYVKGTDQAYLGNTAGDSTSQHNIRIYGSRILCYGNDLTNLPDGSSLATLRVNDGANIYWANNTLHGGQMLVGPLAPESAGALASQAVNTVVIENNRWKEVAGHWSGHDRIHISAGSANIMIRNNSIQATNATAILADTSQYQAFATGSVDRVIRNLQIVRNLATNHGTNGAFLSVGGKQKNAITLRKTTYVAPKLKVGPYATAAVRVIGRNDLMNFTSLASGGGVTGNIWNLPTDAWKIGVNYVSATPAGNTAYRTPREWEKDFPGRVGHDAFRNLL